MTDKELKRLAQMIAKEIKPAVIQALAHELDETFNVQQAANYLHVSKAWLYKIIDEIPHEQKVKGGRLIFYKSSLDEYLREKSCLV